MMKFTIHRQAKITRSLALLSLLATASAFAQTDLPALPALSALPALPDAQDTLRSVQPLARDSATVYRQALGDGRVLYTDAPLPGKKIEKVIEVDLRSTLTWSSQPNLASVTAQRPVATSSSSSSSPAQPGAAVDRPDMAASALDAAKNQLAQAESRFASANAAAIDIDVPLVGERSFNVNGRSRLNDLYFARQTRLRDAVHQTGLELDAALSKLRAAQGR